MLLYLYCMLCLFIKVKHLYVHALYLTTHVLFIIFASSLHLYLNIICMPGWVFHVE